MNDSKPVISFFFGSADLTGAPKVGWYMARAFIQAGYRVVAIVGQRPTKDASVIELLEQDGVSVIQEQGFDALWSMSLVRRCRDHLAEHRPQLLVSVVQNDLKVAALVARKLKVPLVVMGQSLTTFYGPAPLKFLKRFMYGYLVRRSQSIICVSEVVAKHYRAVHGIPAANTSVISAGIEVNDFQPKQAGPARTSSEVRMLNVGRLDLQKGQDLLLDALMALPEPTRNKVRLQFVGGETISSPASQQFSAKLRKKAEAPELRGLVEFCGWRNDVPALLHNCDVYVHAARWEGLGLAVVEAMAVGLPVIYTDCAGRFEGFVDGIHGYMVKAGDTAALSSALGRMIELSHTEREKMGRLARESALAFYDIEKLGERFVAQCETLLPPEAGAKKQPGKPATKTTPSPV